MSNEEINCRKYFSKQNHKLFLYHHVFVICYVWCNLDHLTHQFWWTGLTSLRGMYHLSWNVNFSPLPEALYLAHTRTSLKRKRWRSLRQPSASSTVKEFFTRCRWCFKPGVAILSRWGLIHWLWKLVEFKKLKDCYTFPNTNNLEVKIELSGGLRDCESLCELKFTAFQLL